MPADVKPTRLVDQLKGGLDAPICLTWEITYGCNLACVHCLSSSGRRDPRELSTAEARAVIDELHELQVFYVNIGGGEPTIRPDFYELVDYSVAQGVGVKFSTNGSTITPERARRLSATDYVDVQISIDGADAATNDAVRGEGPTGPPGGPWIIWPPPASDRSRSAWSSPGRMPGNSTPSRPWPLGTEPNCA